MLSTAIIDLSAISDAQREAVAAVLRERDALKEANKRLEHLFAELDHAAHGKRSEKLSEDDRQLAFEDLKVAVDEAEEKQETQAPSESRPRRAARRNRRHPADRWLPGYNRLTHPARKGGDPVRVAHCWAHALRKLKEVFDRDGSEIAAEGLRRITELYKFEADIRGTAPGQWFSARQARTAALVFKFGEWLKKQRLRVCAKSRPGKKLAYIHRHWDGLRTFLHDGRVEIESNSVEDLIRSIALSRKNALFAGHDEGGRAWGRIAWLIETAKINCVEP